MDKNIHITKGFSLPVDLITRRVAVIGISGSGKSNTAHVLVEKMLRIGAQIVILDNDGSHYGLRLGSDGSTNGGFDIPIFGGDHGDIPLDYRSGSLVADVVVDRNISVILDVSDFQKNQRRQFATEFATRLYRRKKSSRSPIMFVIEETEEFLPQRFGAAQAEMVGAFEDITKRGRKYGIGSMMISQRPQSINKEGLNQAEIIFAHYTYGSQERKALAEWLVEKKGEVDIVNELPYLEVGQAYVWSPRWLGETRKVQMPLKDTFDAAKTPEFGGHQKVNAVLALDPDWLIEIQSIMSDAIQQAQENDPAALKRQIAELKRQLQTAPQKIQKPEPIYIPALTDDDRRMIENSLQGIRDLENLLKWNADQFGGIARQISEAVIKVDGHKRFRNVPEMKTESAPGSIVPRSAYKIKHSFDAPGQDHQVIMEDLPKLGKAQRSILTVLAQYPQGRADNQLAILSGYAVGTGGFNNAISSLKSAGYIVGNKSNMQITDAGLDALGDFEPLPTGPDLRSYWMAKLGKAERQALGVLISIYPSEMVKDDVAIQAGYQPGTGGINNAFSRLNTLELIVSNNGYLSASPILFE